MPTRRRLLAALATGAVTVAGCTGRGPAEDDDPASGTGVTAPATGSRPSTAAEGQSATTDPTTTTTSGATAAGPSVVDHSFGAYQPGGTGSAPTEATVVTREPAELVVRGTVFGRNGCAERRLVRPPAVEDGALLAAVSVGYDVGPTVACTQAILALPYELVVRFDAPFEGPVRVEQGGYGNPAASATVTADGGGQEGQS
jgi:hypothetical protein